MRRLVLEIALILFLLGCFIILYLQIGSLKGHQEIITKLEKENLELKTEREALKGEILELEDSVIQYSRTVEIINGKIEDLRQQRYEKIDVIVNLPLDESVRFLSNYLSKDSSL